ncbi:MAG: methyltransferase domain-containing protein [Gammaproteobacteria bacterium]|nr:methyltransferase domain-containing protein [Gammaproteobacteria bacterium]
MRNPDQWRPTKFVRVGGRLRASRDPAHVGVGSRLAADLTAAFYDSKLPLHCRGRLVDLGCGDVPLYEAYRDLASEIVCVDWAHSQHVGAFVDRLCDLSQPLPFDAGSFDTIILSDVLEHVPEPVRLWSEMARILAPGGKLIMNVPFYYCVHETPHDYYRYTEHALRRSAETVGLGILLLEATGGSPEILADITAKHLQFVPAIGKPLAALVQGITAAIVRGGPGRRLSQRTATAFPFGYFMIAEKPVSRI